jgi:hypothetical protein
MAVTIEKKFCTSDASYRNDSNTTPFDTTDLQQIVFTSTNMSDNITAGTRSHTQPGGQYLGTWYESFDILHKASWDQNYLTYPTDTKECMYRTLTLLSGTFTLRTGATATFWHNYKNTADTDVVAGNNDSWIFKIGFLGETLRSGTTGWETHGNAYFHYDNDVRGYIDSYTFGTTTISGVDVNTVDITFGLVTGEAVLSGTLDVLCPTFSGIDLDVNEERRWGGDSIYNRTDDLQTRLWEAENWYLNPCNAVIFELTFGEAYDCRLTAWDDDTHATTNNKILDEGHYRVDAVTYRYTIDTVYWSEASDSYRYYSMDGPDSFVTPPARDQVLKGNDFYYGDFNLVYAVTEYGECLIFKPRLHDMNDSFTAGNYDFVTTLHYQYT